MVCSTSWITWTTAVPYAADLKPYSGRPSNWQRRLRHACEVPAVPGSCFQCGQDAGENVIRDGDAAIGNAGGILIEPDHALFDKGGQNTPENRGRIGADAGTKFRIAEASGKAQPEDGGGGGPFLAREKFELRERQLGARVRECLHVMGETANVFPLPGHGVAGRLGQGDMAAGAGPQPSQLPAFQ